MYTDNNSERAHYNYNKVGTQGTEKKEIQRSDPKQPPPNKPKFAVAVSNTAKLNIRIKPSMTAAVAHIVNFDDRLLVEYENAEWAKVLTKSKEGFAMRAFLKEV